MAGNRNMHTRDGVETGSMLRKLFELAVGPGLMLAVLIALGAHLFINGEIAEGGFFTADTGPAED